MTTVFLNILYGIISSFIFLILVLYLLRPSIIISDKISIQFINSDGFKKETCVFKIVNCSWFSAFDVQLELFKIEQYKISPNGINNRFIKIHLTIDEIKHIPPYRTQRNCHRRNFAPHATLFRTDVPLADILKNEDETLQLQVTLRHGLTGLSRVYQKDYISINDIKEGSFSFGNNLTIN